MSRGGTGSGGQWARDQWLGQAFMGGLCHGHRHSGLSATALFCRGGNRGQMGVGEVAAGDARAVGVMGGM